jgi:deoxyribodipyrimidine photo-lyase
VIDRVHAYDDALLTTPGSVLTQKMEPYAVFTPFYRAASTKEISRPHTSPSTYIPETSFSTEKGITIMQPLEKTNHLALRGGRESALHQLEHASQLSSYRTSRDVPSQDGTSRLSPYLKLGCLSVREVYHALVEAHPRTHEPLTRQLYWRDFFTHLLFFHPTVLGSAFKPAYDRIKWDSPGEAFELWKRGETGFPIVDAGMRQLNATGWMHNRVRMITASFLVKDLHIDWREGERYFAQQLIDYDPAVNNGSWQWVAGTGADAAPYFRIFNPWLQQKKFDPDATYIKMWVKELSDVPVATIHAWEDEQGGLYTTYPRPMLNHRLEADETKRRFGVALS